MGAQALRKHVMELVWKRYNDSIPDLLKQIRSIKKQRSDELLSVQQQMKTLDNNKLRSFASNYVSDFLQFLVSILGGSTEGNPSLNGQTSDEERQAAGNSLNFASS